jgi:hypothetical protein
MGMLAGGLKDSLTYLIVILTHIVFVLAIVAVFVAAAVIIISGRRLLPLAVLVMV